MTTLSSNAVAVTAEPESADLRLARNLTAARVALGWTQETLAEAAQVSRATIVQIEHGLGDPRLSTLSQLAQSLGISLFWLLMGRAELQALGEVLEYLPPDPRLQRLTPSRFNELQQLVASGMIVQRKKAARHGATLARAAGLPEAAVVTTAIATAILPGPGTVVGATLGERCARHGAGK